MYVNSWVPSDKVKNGEVSAFPQLMVDQLIKVIEAYNAKKSDDLAWIDFQRNVVDRCRLSIPL